MRIILKDCFASMSLYFTLCVNVLLYRTLAVAPARCPAGDAPRPAEVQLVLLLLLGGEGVPPDRLLHPTPPLTTLHHAQDMGKVSTLTRDATDFRLSYCTQPICLIVAGYYKLSGSISSLKLCTEKFVFKW